MKNWAFLTKGIALMCIVGCAAAQDQGNHEHLAKCIKIAEPMIKDPKYTFPLSAQDISDVCWMWERFIQCVYGYASTYMSSAQQFDFNQTIQSNNEMIQKLCSEDPEYQKLYKAYAPCMKRVSTGASYCGNQYKYLTDLVQVRSVSDSRLCCGHLRFRDCVLEKTSVECDGGGMLMGSGNSPSQYMRELIDQTMGFLIQKCKDFIPNPQDCPSKIQGVTGTLGDNSVSGRVPSGDLTRTSDQPFSDAAIGLISTFASADPPPSRRSSTTPPTTRFTWTTRRPSGGPETSRKPGLPINLAGNELLGGPASQQFKDSGVSVAPRLGMIILISFFLINL